MANEVPAFIAPDRYVTIRLYATISGMSVEAIRMKIKAGKWLENREYIRSPDGGLFVDREGVQRWMTRRN